MAKEKCLRAALRISLLVSVFCLITSTRGCSPDKNDEAKPTDQRTKHPKNLETSTKTTVESGGKY